MLELLLLWGYIGVFNAVIGLGICKLLQCFVHGRAASAERVGLAGAELAGIVGITVYAEAVSLFAPVSAGAHLILLAAACAAAGFLRKDLQLWVKEHLPHSKEDRWRMVFYLTLVVFTAFFACQGTQHTDTGIYHAQAIRWYEEYGVVKGLGNLQQHFAYNSASLAYAAFFSMKWLVGQSLHGTNGFIQAFLVVWAVDGFRGIWTRKRHLMDGCRIAVILYAVVVSERIMSPATDFSSMYLILWIAELWVSCMENPGKTREEKIFTYGDLSLAAVCAATYKLSAGFLAFAALYPGIWLLKKKRGNTALRYVVCGVLILLPWLARNYVISGWLIYPIAALDLFRVDWKVPVEYLQHDADQIKVWGRCLYDTSRVNDPISIWLPIWWSEKNRPEMMLIIGNILAAAGLAAGSFVRIRRCHKEHEEFPWDKFTLYLAILICIAGWFMTAPFIRYGLAFLLLLPFMVVGDWVRPIPMGVVRIASCYVCLAVFVCMSMYWDYYVLFDMTWIKQHLHSEHLLTQQDYDNPEVNEYELEGGLTIYVPPSGTDNLSYYAFPGSAYQSMAERTKMRGESIKDGFMPR